ncbi:MAG: 30S ribosomal protein S17 [Patescibacteria group bacterium]|nr:mitochondrial small ribosomal subunit protein uS17m [Patescibacteria group bacterium]MBU1953067.1 mitochondrial small ribosomal subunit protein uS17m [Patescibacteria group bacterium]
MSSKKFKGKIVSAKMQKSVVVAVELPRRHPIYDKIVKNTRRFKARNEIEAVLGNNVLIQECKPFSKDVTWKVVEVLDSKEKGK